MPTRTFALLFGIVFALVGVAGFVPAFLAPPAGPALAIEGGHGLLFGLFPVNWVHNVIHLAFGIWGLAAYRSLGGARSYFRSVAVIYGLLTVMGFIPALNTTFGLVPIHGHDIWLHAGLAIVAAIFGFGGRTQEVPVTVPAREHRDEPVRRTGTR
jgi:hypothetical protein